MPHINFDESHCAGHALCHATAPDVYDLTDEGYCVPPTSITQQQFAEAVAGAEACPERALSVVAEP
ncbi:ferredoxin [Mycobacterium sp. TNTM28]|uniref:Ferredoxin n=1 Tax=[Mycobacterium] fortunisiensis TaxID=2600579 RepID=A0ABS6KNF6_9MYCO|nr:ferredoxin [[Mycobacterium] fortunisiensis]MBU9765138.1 ferredoxin [[Mycobacterium] fortunisiensis]